MNLRLLLLVSVLVTGLSSCECDDLPSQGAVDSSVLIFGHFYGECIGENCIETFKLTDSALYEDTLDQYAGSPPFAFVPMSSELFLQVQDLRDSFPGQLWDETEPILGCPDCADQGGLFIQYENEGETRSWRIDQEQSAVPEYLHAFMDQVNLSIALLQ
jgi:hypothetical protein